MPFFGYEDLIDLQMGRAALYRDAGAYVMANGAIKKVKKFKDGQGSCLWPTGGPGLRVHGRPRPAPDGINVTHRFQDALERAGLPRQRFHGLRHCAATLQMQAGTPIETISKMLGHASLRTTVDMYGH